MHESALIRQCQVHQRRGVSAGARRRTAQVLALTLVFMCVEIVAGVLTGSMALLADGWHMATHAAAFGIALFAYRFAARHADNPLYTFGTGKVGVLGGFASAVALAAAALGMVVESILRLVHPAQIQFDEAILVAALGLAVNLASAWMLARPQASSRDGTRHDHDQDQDQDQDQDPDQDHDHDHDHSHDHDHIHGHGDGHDHDHDHNLRGAFLHVLADILTSVLAIAALALGRGLGWVWLDPLMGLAGAALILRWAWSLARETAMILLDGGAAVELRESIRAAVEADGDARLADLHVWHLGPREISVVLSLVADRPHPPEHYKSRLDHLARLAHVIVEVNPCPDGDCGGRARQD